jgi:hypothetical protein
MGRSARNSRRSLHSRVWRHRLQQAMRLSNFCSELYFASAMASIWTVFLAASAVAVTVTWSP